MNMGEAWEHEAEDWVRWVRAPGHDSYWHYSELFFSCIVPPPGRRTLEIGCGEGRVARDLTRRGHTVCGIDTSVTLLRYAREADPSGSYVLADAGSLPFGDGEFDIVVSYNSLMDFEDMAGAVREAARVLVPGGRFCICVRHPMSDSGSFDSVEPESTFCIPDSYLAQRRTHDTCARDGLSMIFHSWHRPLADYAQALESAGFLIEKLREPAAPQEASSSRPAYQQWQRVPMFLHIGAVKA